MYMLYNLLYMDISGSCNNVRTPIAPANATRRIGLKTHE